MEEPKAGETSTSPRIGWVDVLRGIAIVLVVFGHTGRGLDHAGIWPGYEGGFVDRWIYAFHMPAFFFAAGLFARRSLAKGAGRYVATKCSTVLYPYVVWSLIHLLLMSRAGSAANTQFDSRSLARLHYQPVGNYWFLYVLFVWQMLYLLTLGRDLGRLVFVVLALGGWGISSQRPFDWIATPGTFWVWNDALKYGIYFLYGILFSYGRVGLIESTKSAMMYAVAFFVGLTGLTALGRSYQQAWWDLPLALLGINGLSHLSFVLAQSQPRAILSFLGQTSLEIYLAHTLFSAGVRIVLVKLGITEPYFHFIAGMSVGIVGPLCLMWFCRSVGFRWLFTLGQR